MAFNALVPTLEVENMHKTAAFYESHLDFVCANRDENHWALMTKDDVDIMLFFRKL